MSTPPSSSPSDKQPEPTPIGSGDGASLRSHTATKRPKTGGFWEKFVKPGLDVVTLAVSLTGLISIWIAINELRTNEELSWVTTYQTIETLSLEIDKSLIDHPNMVPYFVSNKSIELSNAEYNLALAVADARIGAIDAILTYAAFRHADSAIVGWRKTFDGYFRNSPIMCERLKVNEDNYGLIVALGKNACAGTPFQEAGSLVRKVIRDPIRCLGAVC